MSDGSCLQIKPTPLIPYKALEIPQYPTLCEGEGHKYILFVSTPDRLTPEIQTEPFRFTVLPFSIATSPLSCLEDIIPH